MPGHQNIIYINQIYFTYLLTCFNCMFFLFCYFLCITVTFPGIIQGRAQCKTLLSQPSSEFLGNLRHVIHHSEHPKCTSPSVVLRMLFWAFLYFVYPLGSNVMQLWELSLFPFWTNQVHRCRYSCMYFVLLIDSEKVVAGDGVKDQKICMILS